MRDPSFKILLANMSSNLLLADTLIVGILARNICLILSIVAVGETFKVTVFLGEMFDLTNICMSFSDDEVDVDDEDDEDDEDDVEAKETFLGELHLDVGGVLYAPMEGSSKFSS